MIISVMFLVIYLSVLIPLFINYYGMWRNRIGHLL
jgi:hypothetical protein